MNSLLFSLFVFILFCFHSQTRSHILRGKVRESICALWCMDTVFGICGIIVSFTLYQYHLFAYLTLGNAALFLLYLILIIFFILLAPSGFALLKFGRNTAPEEQLVAEYRFNDMLCLVRNFFMLLLFAIPILYRLAVRISMKYHLVFTWTEAQICGGFCFIAFLILFPISLRQAFFWLKMLRSTPSETEVLLLKQYIASTHYQKRNRRL